MLKLALCFFVKTKFFCRNYSKQNKMSEFAQKMRKYDRILLKLSGEALGGEQKNGVDYESLDFFTDEIIKVVEMGVSVGMVVGGGNIFRGMKGAKIGFERISGDYMGMLATVINSLALQSVFETKGYKAKVLTSTFMEPYAERYMHKRAKDYLDEGYVVLFAGGTGNPFFTTDSAAALRAVEIGADILLKGTNVDGVYSDNPKSNPNAVRFDEISFKEVIDRQLKVMDLTAFTLCYENNLPVIVFDAHKKDNLQRIIKGERIGTLVK